MNLLRFTLIMAFALSFNFLFANISYTQPIEYPTPLDGGIDCSTFCSISDCAHECESSGTDICISTGGMCSGPPNCYCVYPEGSGPNNGYPTGTDPAITNCNYDGVCDSNENQDDCPTDCTGCISDSECESGCCKDSQCTDLFYCQADNQAHCDAFCNDPATGKATNPGHGGTIFEGSCYCNDCTNDGDCPENCCKPFWGNSLNCFGLRSCADRNQEKCDEHCNHEYPEVTAGGVLAPDASGNQACTCNECNDDDDCTNNGCCRDLYTGGRLCSERGSGAICPEVCGDGYVHGSETCDDGNTDNGDGCDENCQIEMPTEASSTTTTDTSITDTTTSSGSNTESSPGAESYPGTESYPENIPPM